MALSDKKILENMEKGYIVIDPFRKENLSTSSYDVTLGEWYFREQSQDGSLPLYNIYDEEHVRRVWGNEPHRARLAEEVIGENYSGIKPTDKVILLAPGETILAHTEEFIGGREIITTMMKARSSLGRNFIEVCKCAGWGDVGYINRWTMEVTNNSRHHHIPLVVGRRIGQIVFFETGPTLAGDYAKDGKYQTESDINQTKANWSPLSMLPKLYRDREVRN